MKALLEKLNQWKQTNDDGKKLISPSVDFLPYACHYAADTLLTKNGELLQIIKIEDFNSDRDIRSFLRSSIIEHIHGNNFALNIHTLRRRNDVSIPWDEQHQEGFSYSLHQSWSKKKQSIIKYVSEIYLTIISRGLENKLTPINLLANFSFSYIRKRHEKHLIKQYDLLTEATNNIKKDLEIFKAKKLQVDENHNSELLVFLKSLITMLEHQGDISCAEQDISRHLLEDYDNAFGFNAMEMIYRERKRFAAVFGVKRYREVGAQALSQAIQLPHEFIISESIDMDENRIQARKLDRQQYLLDISRDDKLKYILNLEDFSSKEKCVNHYINIVPIANSLDELSQCIDAIIHILHDCGLSIFRHDISLEDAFYGIMPANFAFKALSYYTLASNMAGFALLHALNSGKMICEQWGYAIALFWSVQDTPYFFNFHTKTGGHTTIVGPTGAGKTILQNFIISESQKIGTRVFIIDNNFKSKIFINALNGEYKEISVEEGNVPCGILHARDNSEFLDDIIKKIVGKKVDEEAIQSAVEKITSLAPEEYDIDHFRDILSDLSKEAKRWFAAEEYINLLLGHDRESEFWDLSAIGVSFGALPIYVVVVLVSIILKKIEGILDGRPTILVLDEAWRISSVFSNSKVLDDFLQRMQDLNCIVIFSSSDAEDVIHSSFTAYLNTKVSTQIFLPGNITHKGYLKPFNITKHDLEMISSLQSYNRNFFLKQGNYSIVLKLDVSGLQEINVLSSHEKNIRYMDEAMLESQSKDSSEWLPVFYKKLQS